MMQLLVVLASSFPLRGRVRERSHRKSRVASCNPEPPTLATEILEALETKTEELKVVKEVHDSLKHKSVEEKPDFKYKSNKEQFKFNAEVKNKCNQILDRAGADDTITDNQNKLISIVDRDGWE